MKKFSHNKSVRLSISKNWSTIKKKYINKNIYSLENQLLLMLWESFLFKLNMRNDQIIIKEFSQKLFIIIPILPIKKSGVQWNYLRKFNWLVSSVTSLNHFPLFIHNKFINSPYLGAKLLNKFTNEQIKVSTLKESIDYLKIKKDFASPIAKNKHFSLNFIFLVYSIILSTINLSSQSAHQNIIHYSKNKKINLHLKLKNKLFFQKFFFKLSLFSEFINLKLLFFLVWVNPSYHSLTKLLLNFWRLVRISNKYSRNIQGYTLKFRGKLAKFPRKEKIKINQGSVSRLNIKTNLKVNYDTMFISTNGTSNLKFFINY